MNRTLVLTAYMAPHRLIPWQEAVQDWFLGKCEILEEYEEIIASAGGETTPRIVMGMPMVVRLVRSVVKHKRDIKFSRVNVFTRDEFQCQYCGKRCDMRQLTKDHVVPRCQGGQTTWTNIVSACMRCNHKKDRCTPEQAGMKLLKAPVKPKTLPIPSLIINLTPHPKMIPYLSAVGQF